MAHANMDLIDIFNWNDFIFLDGFPWEVSHFFIEVLSYCNWPWFLGFWFFACVSFCFCSFALVAWGPVYQVKPISLFSSLLSNYSKLSPWCGYRRALCSWGPLSNMWYIQCMNWVNFHSHILKQLKTIMTNGT